MAHSSSALSEQGSLLGLWELSVPTPDGIDLVSVVVSGEPGNYQGTFDGKQGKEDMKNIKIDGAWFSFDQEIEKFFTTFTLSFNGVVEGNQLKGELDTPMGSKEFKGVRKQ